MAGTTNWKAGFKKGSVWGTAVALGAGNGVLLQSESMPEGIPEAIRDENVGQSLSNKPLQGNISAEGSFAQIVRYEGFERQLALFMGADAVTVVVAGQAFEHVMLFKPSNDGLFGTLAIDKGIASGIWEYPSVKQVSLELSHDNSRLVAAWDAIVNKCARAGDGIVNTSTEIAALTYPATDKMAIFQQLTLLLKEVTGAEGNLASGDEILVSSVSVKINRNLSGDFVAGTKAGQVDEPQTDGLPEAELMFTVPQYTAAIDAILKESQKRQTGSDPKQYKAQLTWLGNAIPSGSGNNYRMVLDLPCLVLKSAPANAGGPGSKVPVELSFEIATPPAAGNGTEWAWVTAGGDPFRARIQNKNATAAA